MKKNKQGKTTKKSVKRFILLALVLVIILAALWLLKEKMSSSQESSPKEEATKDEGYDFIGSNYCYYIKDDIVYFKVPAHSYETDADPETFEELGECYGKDKDSLYYRDNEVQGIDLATLEYHKARYGENREKKAEGFFTDKNGLYAIHNSYELKLVEGADPETFENSIFEIGMTSNVSVSRDKNNLYYNNEYKIEGIIDIKNISTYKNYLKDKYHVYWLDNELSKNENGETVKKARILDLDPDTFTAVGWAFVKDKNNVYCYDKKFPLADAKTFEVAPSQSDEVDYTKDKNHVYYYEQIVEGADPATFKEGSLGYSEDKNGKYIGAVKLENEVRKIEGYETDGKNVWYSYKSPKTPIEGADAKTFEALGYGYYAKDKNQVYLKAEAIKHADPATFEVLGDPYSKDKHHVYHSHDIIEEADPKSFMSLDFRHSKDKNNVYCEGKILEGADSATFEALDSSYSRDKHHVYIDSEIAEEADPKSFELLDYPYSKDKNHIYYYDDMIEGVDVESFEILEEDYSKDKNHTYRDGEIYLGEDR